MLSLFPDLLNYPIFAAVILRLIAAGFFLALAVRFIRTLRNPNFPLSARVLGYGFAILELIAGCLLLVGLFTQAAALLGAVLTFISAVLGFGRGNTVGERYLQVLLHAVCLSLLFLGAGVFAFDLPL